MWANFKIWLHKPRRDGYTSNFTLFVGFAFVIFVLVAAVLIREDWRYGSGAAKYNIHDDPRHQEALKSYFKVHSEGSIKPFETISGNDDE